MDRIFNEMEEQIEEMFGVDPIYYGEEARWAVDKTIEIVNQTKEKYKDKFVSIGAYKQVAWERDIAVEQLHELGYEFGQKIDSNDGWIPVSERLPDTDREVLVSVRIKDHEEDDECFLAVTSYGDREIGIFKIGKGWRPAWEYWGYWEVVAWKDETPYQPKGEK